MHGDTVRKETAMARVQARELQSRRHGDRAACPLCQPRADRVSMDQLWHWSLEHPGCAPFRPDGQTGGVDDGEVAVPRFA